MMFITTTSQTNPDAMPKQFRVILSNDISSRHALLVIDLQKPLSFRSRFLVWYKESPTTPQNQRQHSCIFDQISYARGFWAIEICRIFIFQRAIVVIAVVFWRSYGRLTTTSGLPCNLSEDYRLEYYAGSGLRQDASNRMGKSHHGRIHPQFETFEDDKNRKNASTAPMPQFIAATADIQKIANAQQRRLKAFGGGVKHASDLPTVPTTFLL